MGARILLGISALVWLPYGIFCLLQPAFLEGAAGVAAKTATGTVELRAMYGGLQAAIGVLCGLGFAKPEWRVHALVTLGFLTAGLGLARLAGAAVDGDLSPYTVVALLFEFGTAGLALHFVRGEAAWSEAR